MNSTWEFLDGIWQRAWAPPDNRPIYDWIAAEVELPNCYAVSGRFDPDPVPFIKAPMDAWRKPIVRSVICQCSVQSLKTLIAEFLLLDTIVNNPGPTQWLQPTDEEGKEHAEERFNQLLKACARVYRYYSENRHDKKTTAIIFKHMWLRMEGAENMRNLQRKSVKTQICSEVWQWAAGRLSEAEARLTQFVHNSSRYIESQPGELGDDMDLAYRSGSQKVWNVACVSCGRYQPPKWALLRENGSRAGMRWEDSPRTRRESGEWRWGELESTVRYECVHCGFGMTDDPRTRHLLNATGKPIAQNPDAPASIESFSWNQLTVANLPWFGMVRKFLKAEEEAKKGNDVPLKEFYQKVCAEPWDPEKFTNFQRLPSIEIRSAPEGKFWELQDFIFMTVDVQMNHFWVLVIAWSRTGECLILWADHLVTWADVRDKQEEFKILDQCVFVDSRHRQNEVYTECVLHGHWEETPKGKAWRCWKALKGDNRAEFIYSPRRGPHKGKKIRLPYSWPAGIGDPSIGLPANDPNRVLLRGRFCAVIFWSNPTIKDIAAKRREDMERGVRTLIAPTVGEVFSKHMYSEEKGLDYDGHGFSQYTWKRIGHRPNHLWDCFCMGIVAACMAQIIGETLPPE